MKDRATIIGCATFFVLIIGVAAYIQMGVWNECRAQDHSFFYCLNLIRR